VHFSLTSYSDAIRGYYLYFVSTNKINIISIIIDMVTKVNIIKLHKTRLANTKSE